MRAAPSKGMDPKLLAATLVLVAAPAQALLPEASIEEAMTPRDESPGAAACIGAAPSFTDCDTGTHVGDVDVHGFPVVVGTFTGKLESRLVHPAGVRVLSCAFSAGVRVACATAGPFPDHGAAFQHTCAAEGEGLWYCYVVHGTGLCVPPHVCLPDPTDAAGTQDRAAPFGASVSLQPSREA